MKMKKRHITLITVSIFIFLISSILSSLVKLRDVSETACLMNYRIGEDEKEGFISKIERSILQGFTREAIIKNLKRENFHSLQVSGDEGEMSFLVGEEFFLKELSKEQVKDILRIAINEREYKNE